MNSFCLSTLLTLLVYYIYFYDNVLLDILDNYEY